MSTDKNIPDHAMAQPASITGKNASCLHIPRVGDEWEFKLPGKSKKLKIVGSISHELHLGKWDKEKCRHEESMHPRVYWKRQRKGRYTSLRVKWLLKYGRRISTEAERDAKFEALIAKRRAERTDV